MASNSGGGEPPESPTAKTEPDPPQTPKKNEKSTAAGSPPAMKKPGAKTTPKKTPKKKEPKAKGTKTPKKKPAAKGGGKGKKGKGKGQTQAPKEPKGKPLKRPSSKNESNKEQGGKRGKGLLWSEGLLEEQVEANKEDMTEEAEEETKTCDEAVDPEKGFAMAKATPDTETTDTKDRSKNKKFLNLLKNGQLPDWLLHEWKQTEKMGSGKLEKRRKIVNGAIDCVGGRLVLNTEKPYFKQMESSYSSQVTKEKEKSLPRRLLMGKFNLTANDFDEALADGELMEVKTASGAVQYCWSSNEHIVSKGKSSTRELEDKKQVDVGDKAYLQKNIRNWAIGLFAKEESSASSSAKASAAPLALENAITSKQWEQAQTQLSAAMSGWDKLMKSAKTKLQTVGVDAKDDPLWNKLQLGHMSLECE